LGRRLLVVVVTPLVVMLADVAHLYLEACRVGRHVGEHAPLVSLHEHVGWLARDRGFGPIGVADGQAGGVEPGIHQLFLDYLTADFYGADGVQESPHRFGDVVSSQLLVIRDARAWQTGLTHTHAYVARAVQSSDHVLSGAVRVAVRAY